MEKHFSAVGIVNSRGSINDVPDMTIRLPGYRGRMPMLDDTVTLMWDAPDHQCQGVERGIGGTWVFGRDRVVIEYCPHCGEKLEAW